MDRNSFDILGVSPAAEAEVIDAAYRTLMKKYHPDRWRGAVDEGRERSQEINAAYAAIKTGEGARGFENPQQPEPPPTPIEISITPPLAIGRNLVWAVLVSAAVLAIIAAITGS